PIEFGAAVELELRRTAVREHDGRARDSAKLLDGAEFVASALRADESLHFVAAFFARGFAGAGFALSSAALIAAIRSGTAAGAGVSATGVGALPESTCWTSSSRFCAYVSTNAVCEKSSIDTPADCANVSNAAAAAASSENLCSGVTLSSFVY